MHSKKEKGLALSQLCNRARGLRYKRRYAYDPNGWEIIFAETFLSKRETVWYNIIPQSAESTIINEDMVIVFCRREKGQNTHLGICAENIDLSIKFNLLYN